MNSVENSRLARIHNVGKVPRMSNINYTMRMMVTEGYLSVMNIKQW